MKIRLSPQRTVILIVTVLVIIGFVVYLDGRETPKSAQAAASEFGPLEQYRVTAIPERFHGTWGHRGFRTIRVDENHNKVAITKDYPYDPKVKQLHSLGLEGQPQTVIDAAGFTDQKLWYDFDTGKLARVEQEETKTWPHMFVYQTTFNTVLLVKSERSAWIAYSLDPSWRKLDCLVYDPDVSLERLLAGGPEGPCPTSRLEMEPE